MTRVSAWGGGGGLEREEGAGRGVCGVCGVRVGQQAAAGTAGMGMGTAAPWGRHGQGSGAGGPAGDGPEGQQDPAVVL